MKLVFASSEFIFRKADGRLIPCDWDTKVDTSIAEAIGDKAEISNNECTVDVSSGPGEYYLWLSAAVVERARDHRTFAIPLLLIPSALAIEARDLTGIKTVEFEPDSVFEIIAIDKLRNPIPSARLNLYGDMVTIIVECDDKGSAVFLGNPTAYKIDLPGDMGLMICPL